MIKIVAQLLHFGNYLKYKTTADIVRMLIISSFSACFYFCLFISISFPFRTLGDLLQHEQRQSQNEQRKAIPMSKTNVATNAINIMNHAVLYGVLNGSILAMVSRLNPTVPDKASFIAVLKLLDILIQNRIQHVLKLKSAIK